MESVRELLAGQGFGPDEAATVLYALGGVTYAIAAAATKNAVWPAVKAVGRGAASLVRGKPDPVFARLMAHFDDPDAMTTAAGDRVYRLETGSLDITLTDADEVRFVRDRGYDVYADLTAKERKAVGRRVAAKIAEVIERDRQDRRAKLSAPKDAPRLV